MPSRENHSETEWRKHLNTMAEWYLKERLEYEQIAQRLKDECDFITSPSSVKAKLSKWRCLRQHNDFDLMAQCFLYHKGEGSTISFMRFGKNVPTTDITGVIEQKPFLEGINHSLPEHIRIVPETTEHNTDPLGRTNTSNYTTTDLPRTAAKRQRNDLSDDHRPSRKGKAPSGDPTQQHTQENNSGRQHGEVDEEAISTAGDIEDEERVGNDETDHSQSKSKEKELKRVFAMLQKFGSKDTKATEAVQHAQEVLMASLKEDAVTRRLKDRTDLGPLHSAALKDDYRSAELLLKYGADINARGGSGITALHIASVKGHLEFVRFLLQQPGIDTNALCGQGATPLMHALSKPYRHCALLLLHHGASVDAIDEDGRTALHYACAAPGMAQIVDAIIAQDTNVNQRDKNGRTPLHRVLGLDHDEYVAPLLGKGASLNVSDKEGRSPFIQACFDAPTAMLLQLLQHDVDLIVKGEGGETALHILCQNGRNEVVQQVLARPEVDINAKTRRRVTPLMLAVANGHRDTVHTLVNKGADLDICDIDSDTALIQALDRGHTEIAAFLIKSGSPVNPVGHSMLKWRTQVENEHRSQQELFALNSKPSQRCEGSQQVPHSNINIQMQSSGPFHEHQQSKVQEVLNNLVTQIGELRSMQQNTSGISTKSTSGQFTFNTPMPTSMYNAYGGYQTPHFFGMGMDMGMDDVLG